MVLGYLLDQLPEVSGWEKAQVVLRFRDQRNGPSFFSPFSVTVRIASLRSIVA